MITIREYIEGKADLAIAAYGTSEGANKGWDKRGRGRAKKNFEPPSSTVEKPDKGYWVRHTDNDAHTVRHYGPTTKDDAERRAGELNKTPGHKGEVIYHGITDTRFHDPIEYNQKKIAEADAKMPEAIRNVMSPPRK